MILTSVGRDGTNGATLIHAAGGYVSAEGESSCIVWGMPRSVIEAGVTDKVVPLQDNPTAIEKAAKS